MTKLPSDVDVFFALLKHPHADALKAIRKLVLAADPSISEGIKWNVPSFQTTEYFATLHVSAKVGVGVILHFGAKKRDSLSARGEITDPTGLLAWLSDDRAVVAFADLKDVKAKAGAFTAILRQWIAYV